MAREPRRNSRDTNTKAPFQSYDIFVGTRSSNQYYSTEVGHANARTAMHEAGAKGNKPAFAVNRQTGEVDFERQPVVKNTSEHFEGALTK